MTESGAPGEGRGGNIEDDEVADFVTTTGGVRDCDGVAVPVRDGVIRDVPVFELVPLCDAKLEGVGVLVRDGDGVGVIVSCAVPVPLKLIVFDSEDVIDGDTPIVWLDVWDGVCEPVIVLEGEMVIDGVPVDEPVEDEVSDPLIVGDGVDEELIDTLPDNDRDAQEEKVVVGDNVSELLRLLVVVDVGKGVIVIDPVPEIVAVGEGVWVGELEGVDSILDVIDGDANIERLGVAVGVNVAAIDKELLDVMEVVFEEDCVPVGVKLELRVVEGVSMADKLSLLVWEAERPNESVVVGDIVWEELMLIDEEGVGNGEVVEVPVPEIVAVGEGVWVGDEEGVDAALDVIDGEAPDERLAVDEGVIKPDNVVELLNVPDGEFEGDGVPVGVRLALMVVDGVSIAVGLSLPLWEADKPNESVVVGVLEEEELTLTVVEEVCELVPDVVGVEVPVSEPLGVCVFVDVPVGLPVEDGVVEFVAIADPVACDDGVNKLLFTADDEIAAVILVLLVPMIPVTDAIDE
jgi:hypothetical protein